MSFIRKLLKRIKEDSLMGRVVRNTGYLLTGTSIVTVLAMVQSIMAGNLLGATLFGVIDVITKLSSLINVLLSFRMNEIVVKYLGEFLPNNQKEKAGALIKAAALAEGSSSIIAFIILILVSPIAAQYLAKDPTTQPLFVFYGISILGNIFTETSTGILQSTDRFRQVALINAAQSILTAGIILYAFLFQGDLFLILTAYLAGKLILGLGPVLFAMQSLNENLGKNWWKASFKHLPPMKELIHFGLNSNFAATSNQVARDYDTLWVALFMDPTAAGFYKAAKAITNILPIPIAPFTSAVYPEISRLAAGEQWNRLKRLISRSTLISAVYSLVGMTGIIIFGRTLLNFYGPEFVGAYPLLIILTVGYGIANLFFWNRPLLLSLNKPDYPFKASFIGGISKLILTIPAITMYGAVGACILLSGYILSVGGAMVLKGLREMKLKDKTQLEGTTV